jgi:hypothetical protein
MTALNKSRRRALVLATAALALPLAACGGSKSDDVAAPGPVDSAAPVVNETSEPAPSQAPAGNNGPSTAVTKGQQVRAAHITSFGWANPALRDPIIDLLKAKKLDTVQLDIKDEDGVIGYDSQLALAKEAGSVTKYYDAKAVTDEIHALGGKVVGRIVAFRDPKLGRWASKNGKMDYVIQDASGNPYSAGNYGVAAFTNFANPDVIEYNVALAEEAAKLGFDGIMFDYVRRPENSGQVYKGIGDRTPAQAIADFIATASPRIRAAGASAGAAVYGISAFAPSSVAQDIPAMAKHLDFISPMIYPSHWNKGEYSVGSPVDQPYDIVKQSLMDFNRMVIGTDCLVVPWLQNFSWPKTYTASDVAAQIKAAKDVGLNSWYLWNDSSKVGIGAPALEARDSSGNAPGTLVYSLSKPGNRSDGSTDLAKAKIVFEAYQAWIASGRSTPWKSPLDENGNPVSTGTTATAEPSASATTPEATTPAATPAAQ